MLLFAPAFAADFEPVSADTQVVYSPSAKFWSNGGMAQDRIVLTKKTSSGSGSNSDYYYSNGKKAFQLGSNYEFLSEGDLIACHNADLKLYKVTYWNKKFMEKQLTEEQIKKLFPDAEIIKISQFKDGIVTVYKPAFHKKEFLLLNDTNKNFHKYSLKPEKAKISDVAGLFKAYKPGKYVFLHFGEDAYTIKVKNQF